VTVDQKQTIQHLASVAHAGGAHLGRVETRARRRWPLAVVGVSTVLLVLLLDVRVEFGRSPAAAKESEAPVAPSAAPAVAPAPSAPPPRGIPKPPGRATRAPTARRFAWAPVAGADAYHVALFLGDQRVLFTTTRRAQLTVPARWTLAGESRRLGPGEYRWYVWPVTSGRRAQNAVVQATLTVP
jgi:hypothetical protein